MNGVFQIPSILVNLAVYAFCLGSSEDCFRLLLYLSSAIEKNSHVTIAGDKAAKRYLGFNFERYHNALRYLSKNKFVRKCDWRKRSIRGGNHIFLPELGIEVPPLRSKSGYTNPLAKESGKEGLFHKKVIAFDYIQVPLGFIHEHKGPKRDNYLSKLDIDTLYCCLNLYRFNRPWWLGVNPNFVRYDLSPLLWFNSSLKSLAGWLRPMDHLGDKIYISPALQGLTQKSVSEIKETIHSLVNNHRLFEWQFMIATNTTYYEQRRSITMDYLIPQYVIDYENINIPIRKAIRLLGRVLNSHRSFRLVAQLRSCLPMYDTFTKILENTHDQLRITKTDIFEHYFITGDD